MLCIQRAYSRSKVISRPEKVTVDSERVMCCSGRAQVIVAHLAGAFWFVFWIAFISACFPNYGIGTLSLIFGLMNSSDRALLSSHEIWALPVLTVLLHIPYIVVIASGHWQATIWGQMWFSVWAYPQMLRESIEVSPSCAQSPSRCRFDRDVLPFYRVFPRFRELFNKYLELTKKSNQSMNIATMGCETVNLGQLDEYAASVFQIEVRQTRATDGMKCNLIVIWVTLLSIFMCFGIPILTRSAKHTDTSRGEAMSRAVNEVRPIHWILFTQSCASLTYVLIQSGWVAYAVDRLFVYLRGITRAFNDQHPVTSTASLDNWLDHFTMVQVINTYCSKASEKAVGVLVIADVLFTGLLLYWTNTLGNNLMASSLFLGTSTLVLLYNSLVLRLIQVVSGLNNDLHESLNNLQKRQLELARQFRTRPGNVSVQKLCAKQVLRGEQKQSQSQSEQELHEVQLPVALARRQSCGDEELYVLERFQLEEIDYIRQGLEGNQVSFLGVPVTRGLLTTLLTLLGTNVVSIVAKALGTWMAAPDPK